MTIWAIVFTIALSFEVIAIRSNKSLQILLMIIFILMLHIFFLLLKTRSFFFQTAVCVLDVLLEHGLHLHLYSQLWDGTR